MCCVFRAPICRGGSRAAAGLRLGTHRVLDAAVLACHRTCEVAARIGRCSSRWRWRSSCLFATRLKGRYRQGSQAFRLTLLSIGLILPRSRSTPTCSKLAHRAKTQLVETRYGPQALNQRQTIQSLMQQSLEQIDMFPGLTDLVSVPPGPVGSEAVTDRAFQVWRLTGLATYPITSSVELFGPDGRLVSRFAFNLPDDLNAVPTSEESVCTWEVFEEVSRFSPSNAAFSARAVQCASTIRAARRMSSARSSCMHCSITRTCRSSRRRVRTLSCFALLSRSAPKACRAATSSSSSTAGAARRSTRPPTEPGRWTMSRFAQLVSSRAPVWARLLRDEQPYERVPAQRSRRHLRARFPVVTVLGHMMNLAELTVIAAVTFFFVLMARGRLQHGGAPNDERPCLAARSPRQLLPQAVSRLRCRRGCAGRRARPRHEQLRGRSDAGRTSNRKRSVPPPPPSASSKISSRHARRSRGIGIDDNLMVWVSRLIDQDVNIFTGPRLLATSERNLFASGVLPVRTPADVYVALQLRNEAATVTSEQVGGAQPFLVAGTRMTARQIDAILTVPLASRGAGD
jgi:hypothetical protein